jgi:hypothetical protein
MTTEIVTLQMLENLINSLSGPKEVKRDEDSVIFKYRDKDGDNVPCVVRLLNEEKASVVVLIPIPDSHSVTAMIVSNFYNNQSEAHGTFAYTTKIGEDAWAIALESHISTRGGISESAVRHQLRTLIEQVNGFEKTMIEGIQKLGPDSSFLKGGFLQALGSLAGGFLRGYSDAR